MKDGEIKHKLSPAQVSVMLHRVTEPPYFGRYWDHFEDGAYRCAACDTALFSSEEKFDSKTGWPSFKKPINERDLQFKSEAGPDDKVEIRCKKCKGHLGYVISGDNPYYRINSVCLIFEKRIAPVPITTQDAQESTQPKKSASKKAAAAERTVETPPVQTGWTTGSLIAGSIIALCVGMLCMYLYLTYTPLPTVAETATSTPQTASTTPENDIVPATDDTPAETVPEEPQTAPEQAPVSDTGTTSTQ